VRTWPEVVQVELDRERLQIGTRNAEALLVRLLREDPGFSDIEVKPCRARRGVHRAHQRQEPKAQS